MIRPSVKNNIMPIAVLLSSILCINTSYAEQKVIDKTTIKNPIYLCVYGFYDSCGLLNVNGHWKAPPVYWWMSFKSDIWIAKLNDSVTHILNVQGDKLSVFNDAERVADNLLAAHPLGGSRVGLYTYDGKEVVSPRYSYVSPFSEGVASAGDSDKIISGDFLGYIDLSGRWIIKPQYRHAESFQSGLAAVRTTAMSSNENILINKAGVVVTPYREGYSYEWVGNNRWQSTYAAPTGEKFVVAIYNEKGEIVKKDIQIIGQSEDDITIYKQAINGKDAYGIINIKNFNPVVLPSQNEWFSAHGFENGTAKVISNEGVQYVDHNGNITTEKNQEIKNNAYKKLLEAQFFSTNFNDSTDNQSYNLKSPWAEVGSDEVNYQADDVWWIEKNSYDTKSSVKILAKSDGKVLLTYSKVNNFNNEQCGGYFTVIRDQQNKVVWPTDPTAMCDALSGKSGTGNNILSNAAGINGSYDNLRSVSYPKANKITDKKLQSDLYPSIANKIVFETPPSPTLPKKPTDNGMLLPGDIESWVKGPAIIQLSDVAKLNLPNGYYFIPRNKIDIKENKTPYYIVELYEGSNDNHLFHGVIMPENSAWISSLVTYYSGFIDTSNLAKIDSDIILKTTADRTLEFGSIDRLQWVSPPIWNAATQRLTWGLKKISISSSSSPSLTGVKFGNQKSIELALRDTSSREGNAPNITHVNDEFNHLLDVIVFNPGEEHKDYKTGDNRSALSGSEIITGPPSRMEVAITENIRRENTKKKEDANNNLIRTLCIVLLFVMPGIFMAMTKSRGRREDPDNKNNKD